MLIDPVCVGVYICVGWNPCAGRTCTSKVSSEEPTPSSIKISQVTDLTDDDSLRLLTSKSTLFIHVGWNLCPGYTTEVRSKEPTPTSMMISQVADLRTAFID